ncbi:hypothetical protein [Rhodoblastus sp.]|uniref:hypothetical protein n=1 Tax=Rhodoblastus sp. TaxID=1962975 RepID=UPI003F95AB1C
MQNEETLPRESAQVIDFLEAMFRAGRAPRPALLLSLVPDEPLADIDFDPDVSANERAARRREARALVALFPGYQADRWKRLKMKYVAQPDDDSSLMNHVRSVISYLKARWSEAVEAGTRLKFADWLGTVHITPLWLELPDFEEAVHLVGFAFGMQRNPATWTAD